MMLSSMTVLFTLETFAAEETTGKETTSTETGSETESETEAETGSNNSGNNNNNNDKNKTAEELAAEYLTNVYATPEEKLAKMKLSFEYGDYQLYVDNFSGEVACKNTKTNEVIFTNPYDVGTSTGAAETKYDLLSQLMVEFSDGKGQIKTFTSFKESAERQQIKVEPIKGGVRVEYAIGREQAKTLVPRRMTQESFEENILTPILEYLGPRAEELYNPDTKDEEIYKIQQFFTYFTFYALELQPLSASEREKVNNLYGLYKDNINAIDSDKERLTYQYEVLNKKNIFVFKPDAKSYELERCEQIVMDYCPDYTYEQMDADHEETLYESDDENPPVFRMALEYKIDAEGLTVRLPANGIRFNESLYTLESITVLPYMGAGSSAYTGYNFFPDGSGALFRFEDLCDSSPRTVVGKVYGTDFAYHEISGTYQKTIRYPVFGIVEDTVYYNYYTKNEDGEKDQLVATIPGSFYDTIKAVAAGGTASVCKGREKAIEEKFKDYVLDKTDFFIVEEVSNKHGFVAIIEEGDALTSLTTYHAGTMSDYNTVMMAFTPRPKDTYNLQDAISVSGNTEWTVVSDRKYVGGYKVRYKMLSETTEEDAANGTAKYDASWLGMAKAYRDYLSANGVISPLTDKELTNDIPLYIETFGAVKTVEKILSIPVTVMAPLTTFEDVAEMYEKLKGDGIKNINFKLTGYTNGGMGAYNVPTKIKFEKVVGGNDGFQELLNKANGYNTDSDPDTNFGIFPDFNLAYVLNDRWFDGFSWNKHCAKTIDDRYAARREYSPTQQKYENFYETVVSPAYFYVIYEGIQKYYANKYDNIYGISVSSLGNALNSDFDEDEPYNREDSKQFTKDALAHFDKTYKQVMTDGGNAYVWKYVDHMLSVSLDSSRYSMSSNAVPFIGVVLHGSISFAGEPLNMEGDLKYAILKAIENGASPYFILSMQNTQALKEYTDLSRYYSIRYDIWSKDIADVYEKLNGVLNDVQDKYIINHEFLENGLRVPDADELEEDILNIYNQILGNHENAEAIHDREEQLAVSAARVLLRTTYEKLAKNISVYNNNYSNIKNKVNALASFDENYYAKALQVSKDYFNAGVLSGNNSNDASFKIASSVRTAVGDYNVDVDTYKAAAEIVYNTLKAAYENKKLEVIEASILADFASHEAEFVNGVIEAAGDSAALRTVAISYLGNRAGNDAINALVSELEALGTDEAAVKAYFEGRDDHYSKISAEDLATIVSAVVAAGTSPVNIESAFTKYTTAYKPTKAFVDAVVTIINANDGGNGKYVSSLEDYNAAKVENAADDHEAIVAYNAFVANYAELIALYNAFKAGEDALALSASTNATYADAYALILAVKNAELYASFNDETATYIDEINNGYAAYVAAVEAYDNAVAALETKKASGYIDRYLYALATLTAIESDDVDYDLTADPYRYYLNAKNLVASNPQYSRNSAVFQTGDIMGSDYSSIYVKYNEAAEAMVKIAAALEVIYTAEYDRTEGVIENSLVWEEAVEYDTLIKAIFAEMDVIYNDVVGDKAIAQTAVDKAKMLVASTALDEKFAEEVDTAIENNKPVIDDDDDDNNVIIVDDNTKYNTENIVAVTYGTYNDKGEAVAYKTIILNYNNYSVRVTYNGMEYTISAYEYAVVTISK